MKNRISLDCDGVLADFYHGLREAIQKTFPEIKLPMDWTPKNWDVSDLLTEEQLDAVWKTIKATENFWLNLPPYAENVGSLARFLATQKSQDVWLVTSRAPVAGLSIAKQTELWLQAYHVSPHHNYMGIILSEHADSKVDIYRATGIDWSIDDKIETVLQCQKLPKHRAYLLRQPANKESWGKAKLEVDTVEEYLNDITKQI